MALKVLKYRRREPRPDLIDKVQQIDLLRLEQLLMPRPIELLLHCMRQWPPSGVSNHSDTFERSPAVLSSVSGCTYITQTCLENICFEKKVPKRHLAQSL